MSEYIDKWCVVNRLIDLENKFQRLKPFHGNEQDMYEKICELEIFLGKSPAADVVPVVYGKWIYNKNAMDFGIGAWLCSKCGCRNANLPLDIRINPFIFSGSRFCPNCGTKMVVAECEKTLKEQVEKK